MAECKLQIEKKALNRSQKPHNLIANFRFQIELKINQIAKRLRAIQSWPLR
jgi:hypothetical protein